ncbi:hypothetical protein D3C76_191270 [compost metagenome]
MKLNILSKKETKELAKNVTPIENMTGYQAPYFEHLMKIQSWYRSHGLTTNDKQKDIVDKLSNLIGYKPLYHARGEFYSAVWGFEWEGQRFILYRSARGTSIEIDRKFKKTKLEEFLVEFSKLVNAN